MKDLYNIICVFLVLILSSCISKSQENNSLTLIKIEVNIKKMEVVKLSQFTNNIKYVLLENKENLTVVSNTKVDISDNMILIGHTTGCILYDIDGHFISKIGNKGRGPGEYPYITNLSIGKNNKIYLSDTENLYEYKKDGSFVKKCLNPL
jgi:6-bladed beta-propeller